MKTLARVAILVSSTVGAAALPAQEYDPVGPQTDVARATVEGAGWTLCFSAPYDNSTGDWFPTIQAGCLGERTMLSCGLADDPSLEVLAQAPTADVYFPTGGVEETNTDTHAANGSEWYFHYDGTTDWVGGKNAWGFAGAGSEVLKDNCDINDGTLRLCWHLNPPLGGYKCAESEDLFDATFTKYVHVWSSAIFGDDFENEGGDLCSWTDTTEEGCEASPTLTVADACGVAILDQGTFDLSPDPGFVGYRLSWNELRNESGYRLQVDRASPTFEAEDDWIELPPGTDESAVVVIEGSFQHTYRLIAHVGHTGGHGSEAIAGDVVSTACLVEPLYD